MRRLAPVALATALAAVYLVWQPPSLDLAAAEYRSWLFGEQGFAVWNGNWYGGHHLPGYSLLFPPLGHWLGPRVVGALAVVAAAWLFERIAWERYGADAWLGATWFAAGAATTLFSGRLTFALGLVPALGALLALSVGTRPGWRTGPVAGQALFRGRGRGKDFPAPPARSAWLGLALVLALVTPLASPVAALFLALAGTAYWLGERRWEGLALAVAAMAPVLVLAVFFPEGGIEPFVFSAYWPVLAFAAVALLVVLPREERTLRIGVVLYALGCTAAFLVDTPLGGNVVRLGALCAGPVAALVLWPRRGLVLLLLAPFALWWQWNAAVDDVRTASDDPSVHAAYYAPLLDALDRAGARGGAAGRLEIPFTRLHWEARHVAPEIPLARGWERQLDLEVNPLFYGEQTGRPALTAARYDAWLHERAVRWVAVPQDLRLDYSAQEEAELIDGGLPYLRPIWRDANWRLYEVRDPTPLVDAPARVMQLGPDTATIEAPRPATVTLRVRWTPYWAVVAGDACVEPDGDLTRLVVRRAGEIRLATRFAVGRVGARSARCA